jgi:hypothetical protein
MPVGLQLAHFGHQAAKPTRRDPFPNFSTRFPGFCVGDRVRIRHLRVRILLGQPASPVSRGCFPLTRIHATLPGVRETLRGLCCAIFCILGHYGSILDASLWSSIFNIRVVAAETRFDFARDPVRVGIIPNYISRKSRSHKVQCQEDP